MKSIPRYHQIFDGDQLTESESGLWCRWGDVEYLQKELQEARALALAAMQLVPEDENIGALRDLAKEAREVFFGKDKKTIAKLQDELRGLHEYARRIQHTPVPGVNAVYGTKPGDKSQARYVLMLTRVGHASNGGLEIEVQLP